MSEYAIELSGVGKTYPFFSLDNIDLQVPEGEIMGLIGPNGAGKSTTIRILMGLVHQDCGEVRVLGHSMPQGQVAAKWDIGFASEDMRPYESMTLGWHMQFFRSVYANWDERYAQLLVKRFGLRTEQKIKGFSHGQRVKATLLLMLARRPKLLVLDEPTTGLDPVARHEILRELTAVMTEEGRSVLFSSHNTQDVEQISDTITFIDRGRIIDSMDKETYLDRWRRLRLEVPSGITLPALPGIIGVRQDGRLAIATANAFRPDLANAYESTGARVHAIETMTLEEILWPTLSAAVRRWKHEPSDARIDSEGPSAAQIASSFYDRRGKPGPHGGNVEDGNIRGCGHRVLIHRCDRRGVHARRLQYSE